MAESVFMKKLRERMGAIFFVVALLFVGMMVFQWGMNITARRRHRPENTIAVVGEDEKIDYAEYARTYEDQIQDAYNRGQSVDDFVAEDIREQAWQTVVNRHILSHQFDEKLTSGFDGVELYEKLRRQPPDWLKQHPQFQTDGRFDYQKYLDALNDQNVDWTPVERAVASNLPYDKLRTLVSTISFVTMPEAMDEYVFMNTKVRGEYIVFGPDCGEVDVDTSEEALRKYYEAHADSLVKRPYVVFRYIAIPYVPSRFDSLEVRADLDTLMKRIRSGEDFGELAEAYSQDQQSAVNGGDIGWFSRGQLIPEFEAVAFGLDSGEVSEPVLTRYGWHIIRCLGRKVVTDTLTGAVDTLVHLQHILLRIDVGYETAESLDALADDVLRYASEHGIDSAAAAFGLDVAKTPPVGPDEAIPGIGMRTLLTTYAFEHGPGLFPEVVKSQGMLFVVWVDEVVPPKFENFAEARWYVKKRVVSEAWRRRCRELAREALRRIKAGEPMRKVADELGAAYDTTGLVGIFERTEAHSFDPWVSGALLGIQSPDSLSGVIYDGEGRFYIVHLLERHDVDMSNFRESADQVRQAIFQDKRNAAYSQWFANLRRHVRVKDLRTRYFVEETASSETSAQK